MGILSQWGIVGITTPGGVYPHDLKHTTKRHAIRRTVHGANRNTPVDTLVNFISG